MKDEISMIFLLHQEKYPKMQIEDHIKLLYQNCFGPRHLHRTPSRDTVVTYLDNELNNINVTYKRSIEEIGNGFVRVYLDVITSDAMTKESLVDAFISSMNHDINIEEAKTRFKENLTLFVTLCESKQLPYTEQKCKTIIETYLKNGIRPIHHTAIYRQNYQPHYRVVHRNYLL